MKKTYFFALIAAAVLATGCAGTKSGAGAQQAPQTSAAQATDDAAITTKVNAALQADPELKDFKINASTTQGVVKLKGEIKTLALRRKVESVVKGVAGVKSVDNQLVITG